MKRLVLRLIRSYQSVSFFQKYMGVSCRFYPTCSDYAFEAVEKHGVLRGLFLGLYRVLRCNPFNKGGIDKLQ